jgi:hypothetical protein
MTTQEMITEVSASLGNRTDITAARVVSWLNWSIKRLASFVLHRRIDVKYFHSLEKHLNFQTEILSGTMSSAPASDDRFWLAAAHVSATVDYYKDWVVEITDYTGTAPDGLVGQVRIIPSSLTSGLCMLSEDWLVTPDANTIYTLYRRIYPIGVSPLQAENAYSTFWAIQRIERISGGELNHKPWLDIVGQNFANIGAPSAFARRGNSLIFDITPNTGIWYRMWYYAYPSAISALNLSGYSDIPEIWHEVIVLGAIYRGHRALMEPDRAAESRATWYDEITNMTDTQDLEGMHVENRIRMRFK